MKFILLT